MLFNVIASSSLSFANTAIATEVSLLSITLSSLARGIGLTTLNLKDATLLKPFVSLAVTLILYGLLLLASLLNSPLITPATLSILIPSGKPSALNTRGSPSGSLKALFICTLSTWVSCLFISFKLLLYRGG